ncbi:MAG: 50S ribosomal protein L25 [Thermodesulfobacteriota bacterium]
MAQSTLVVTKRVRLGKGGSKKVREEGKIPAILYGKGSEPIPLIIDPSELKTALDTDAGINTLLELKIEEEGSETTKLTFLRDVQYNHITSMPVHFDFQELRMDKRIRVKVPVRITGRSKGVKEGGLLEEIIRDIEVECLPGDIPNSFDLDVTELDLNHSLHVSDIEVDEKVDILNDPKSPIVSVIIPKAVEEEVEEIEEITEEVEDSEETKADSESKTDESKEE